MSNQETIEITEQEYKDYKESVDLMESLLSLSKSRHFKLFTKSFIDDSLKNLGLNLGVQPQMRGEIILQIEARRVFNQFIETAIQQGQSAKEILKGV